MSFANLETEFKRPEYWAQDGTFQSEAARGIVSQLSEERLIQEADNIRGAMTEALHCAV